MMKKVLNDMLSEKDLINIAIQEGCLLEDYKKANNYVGIKIQQAKIDLLDSIILSKDKPNEYVDIEDWPENPLDQEMIELINALNKYNIKTKQGCSGHGKEQAQISIDLSKIKHIIWCSTEQIGYQLGHQFRIIEGQEDKEL